MYHAYLSPFSVSHSLALVLLKYFFIHLFDVPKCDKEYAYVTTYNMQPSGLVLPLKLMKSEGSDRYSLHFVTRLVASFSFIAASQIIMSYLNFMKDRSHKNVVGSLLYNHEIHLFENKIKR